jgi:outer membrane usher protein
MNISLTRSRRTSHLVLVHVLCACAAILIGAAVAAAQTQRAFLTLVLNGVDHGEALVVVLDGDALVTASTLETAGLRNFGGRRETVEGEERVSLASLAPRVTFKIDEGALRLVLTAEPDLLGVVVRNLDGGAPAGLQYRSAPSAFVNYSATGGIGSDSDYEVFTEAGISARGALLTTTATKTAATTIRGLSSLTIDRRTQLQRWVLGDSFISAGPLGGDALVGGVTVGRDFSLAPYFVRYPTMSMSTPVSVPSVLEVHVNGRLVREEQVQPGRIDIRNLPMSSGANDTRLILRDPFGGTQEITSGFYVTSSVLARGIHDYQYAIGFRRQSLGTASWDYQEPVAIGRHRLGLTDAITAGFRLEGARGLISGGPSMNFRLPVGEIELATGVSRTGQRWGIAKQASYTFIGRHASFGGTASETENDYATVSMALGQPRPLRSLSAFGSVPVGRGTTITVQHSEIAGSDDGRESRTSLLGSLRVSGNAELVGNAGRSRGASGRGYEVSLGLTVMFGAKTVAGVSAVRNREGTNAVVDVQRPLPVGSGFGYQFRGESGDRRTATAMAQYQGSYGRYELRRDGIGATPTTTFNISGGLVAIGGGLHPTRAVRGSYALVQVPGVEGVRTLSSNQEIGRTGRSGSLLVPDLLPYYGNLLAITDSDVSLDYEVANVQMTIAPPYRGGAIALFPVRRIQRTVGAVAVVVDGREQVAAYGTLTLTVAGEEVSSPLGAAGEFYFENVTAGRHEAVVTYAQGTCALTIDVPVVAGQLVSLGTLRCAGSAER